MFIVVAVSGGIAAYKSVQLVRLLVQDGHEVHVVPTDDAVRFVGLPTWEAISRNPVTTSVHEDVARVRHVGLGQRADLVILAPATANTLAAYAAGLASNLLGTTLLATTAPVLVAPAMHTEMWRHPATQANLATLRSRGVHVVGPDDGPLTGGDTGPGRMAEPEAIHQAALNLLGPRDLNGLNIVVSAGGTREPIDPVRYLGNRSSGRQGVAIARAAADRGAEVSLIACNIEQDILSDALAPSIEITAAGTAHELAQLMDEHAGRADVVIMAAAVADFRVAEVSDTKLTKDSGGITTLRLTQNPDIVASLAARRRPGQSIIGFAAETATGDDLIGRGVRKRRRKGLDLLAVNEVGWDKGFGTATNRIVVLGHDDTVLMIKEGTKRQVADALLDTVAALRTPEARPHGASDRSRGTHG